MARNTSRRTFLKASAAAGVGYWVAGGVSARPSRSALEEIRFGCIGVGGKGESDSGDAGRSDGCKVVAICDIDEERLNKKAGEQGFDGAAKFFDFRQMLDKMGDNIDAVTVSTPDHTHAPAGLMAMRMGMHCFCQKPMTHSIYEARLMADTAREMGVKTQMGNQGTAERMLRQSAALIKAGAIGDVSEVHIWTNRPVWPQGDTKVDRMEAPSGIHWDDWIGPAKYQDYSPAFHPFKWRGFWDFGTGALGDMACHTLNMSYMALDLKDPVSVQAETSGHNKMTYPGWSIIEYIFPGNDSRGPIKMIWYDGGKTPSKELLAGLPKKDNGQHYDSAALVVGSKGRLYSPGDYGADSKTGVIMGMGDSDYLGQRRFARDFDISPIRSPGHFQEFVDAIKGEGEAMSNFPNYAGGLTETVLLGNLAVWVDGPKVMWDAKNMKATINGSEAPEDVQRIIKPVYREGYQLDA